MARIAGCCRRCGGEYLWRGDNGGYCSDPECQLDDVELACERSAQKFARGACGLDEHEEYVERVMREGLRLGERPSRRNSGVIFR
jgi:hypothetical protein